MITVTVVPDDGKPYDLTATMRDLVLWEKTHKGKRMAQLSEPAATDLYEIAHVAAKRQGKFDGTLAEFMDSCDLAQEDTDEDGVDPTPPGR